MQGAERDGEMEEAMQRGEVQVEMEVVVDDGARRRTAVRKDAMALDRRDGR